MNSLARTEARIFDSRFEWGRIEPEHIRNNAHVLELIREACLVESYFSLYIGKMLQLFWYDLDAVSAFTIEAFEAYTHYFSLRRYLDIVQYRPIEDEEIIRLRQQDRGNDHGDEIRELVNFGMTESFAAQFFHDLAGLTEEPVLKSMVERFSQEETTHAEFAFDLLAKRIRQHPALAERVLQCAHHFRHVGGYVMPRISAATQDNLKPIHAVNRRIEQLVGRRLSDYVFTEGWDDDHRG